MKHDLKSSVYKTEVFPSLKKCNDRTDTSEIASPQDRISSKYKR